MSTECKRELDEITRQRDYYKNMYEMRTEAYIKLSTAYEVTHGNLIRLLEFKGITPKELKFLAIQTGSLK